MIRTIDHRVYLIKKLADREQAAAYLSSVAADGDIKFLLAALRNVVKAQGGIGALAKRTRLSRTSLYKTLSSRGNPEVATLSAILRVYGLQIGFFAVGKLAARGRSSPPQPAAAEA